MNIKLAKSELIHFVGIGGIGMSGLSLIMKSKGFKVQGSDISINKNIERLKKSEIKIFKKHKISNLNKANIVVISSAIKNNNIELNAAKKKDLPIYKRGDMLAHMTSLKKNIVVEKFDIHSTFGQGEVYLNDKIIPINLHFSNFENHQLTLSYL